MLQLVSAARDHIRRGRLAGYSGATGDSAAVARHVRDQARAVFLALGGSGISYVNSMYTMGEYVDRAQRIRLPAETLRLKSANCMDVSVVFASAMENLGLQPQLIILPGHAVAGVRLGRDAQDVLTLDLTVLPKGSFETAIARARSWIRKTPTRSPGGRRGRGAGPGHLPPGPGFGPLFAGRDGGIRVRFVRKRTHIY